MNIPVQFIPSQLAVNTSGAIAMLGMDTKKRPAAIQAFYRFRSRHGIEPIAGTKSLWSVRQIERAVNGKESR